MLNKYIFDPSLLHSVAGGRSAIDVPRLNIRSLEAAEAFVRCYGFDTKLEADVEKLWHHHRRAIVLMTEKLNINLEEIPVEFRDRKQLQDLRQLLIYASSTTPHEKNLQKWACAILRCMHVYVHAENDLFSSFSNEIQSQILAPFQSAIVNDGTTHKTLLQSQNPDRPPIELVAFEVKPFKTSSSTVIKLLAKPDALAMKVFDKLGVRFVTKNLFDVFQVIRFLEEENLISYPHIMPDESSNNLYPVDLFLEICKTMRSSKKEISESELNELFAKKLKNYGVLGFFRKQNQFSGDDYRFVKFITRKLIKVQAVGQSEPFSFFFPFEVQLMDAKAYESAKSGPARHEDYKERQRQAARSRLFKK